MPLWKASYRLNLPADAGAKTARLQGWAVLENFSGRAWNDVSLTLLSGNPVTFRQALYESYYVPRQTVPVESGSHVLPPPDTGTVADEPRGREERAASRSMDQAAPLAIMAKAAPAAPTRRRRRRRRWPGSTPRRPPRTRPRSPSPCPRRSMCRPGRALSCRCSTATCRRAASTCTSPRSTARHPLAAVELTNDSGTGLPPGVLTLYQQGAGDGALYLGDARLAALPAGDKRLLSYAIDNKVTVDRETAERRPVVKATIADGVMKVTRRDPLHDALPDQGRRHAAVDAARAAAPRRRHPDRARPEDGGIGRQRLPRPVHGAGGRQRRAGGGRGTAGRGDDPHHRSRRQPAGDAGLLDRARPEAAPGAGRGREPAAGGGAAAGRARPPEGAARAAGRG